MQGLQAQLRGDYVGQAAKLNETGYTGDAADQVINNPGYGSGLQQSQSEDNGARAQRDGEEAQGGRDRKASVEKAG